MSGVVHALLPDGRLHLQHGPIDLVIGAEGEPDAIAVAHRAMLARFERVLDELVAELPLLRSDVRRGPAVTGSVARRMVDCAGEICDGEFATAMVAVAGSVADEIADAGWSAARLRRLHVNNGGDIAVRQMRGEVTVVGVVDDVVTGRLVGRLHLSGDSGVGGIATSGWGGRSMSLGIADAVTVLAANAAVADVAATLVANAVDLPGHPAVLRRRADQLRDDTDLGDLAVTCGVGQLTDQEVGVALMTGERRAHRALAHPQVLAVILSLRGRRRMVGSVPHLHSSNPDGRDVVN